MRFTDVTPQTVSTRYFHTDHVGSVAVITNENGALVERLSYDAWGKRRFANGADDPAGSIESLTIRGFTGRVEPVARRRNSSPENENVSAVGSFR